MTDEETPPGPPRFPPVEEPPPSSGWPPPGQGWPPPDQHGNIPPGSFGGDPPLPSGDGGGPYGRPGQHWLHPLDIGRAFSSGWRLYRSQWKPMLGALLAISVPVAIVSGVVQGFVLGPAMDDLRQQYLDAIQNGTVPKLSLAPGALGLTYLLGLVAAILSLIANASVIHIVDANYRGGRASATEGLRAGFGRTLTLIGIYVLEFLLYLAIALIGVVAIVTLVVIGALIGDAGLTILLTLIGAVGLLAAFIFFALRWSLAPQAAMVEGIGAVKSLGRSWRLVNGSTWRLLGYALLIGLITVGLYVVGLIVATVADVLLGGGTSGNASPIAVVVSGLLSGIVVLVFVPWFVAVLTLFYFDLRWRRGEPLPNNAAAAPLPPGS